ncbi:hypothetical protein EYF80_061686 [Liparis tanakae]|uniref:Uncharacterized protein n=1 Tax=Liparis tanakae TaxID=230148 RepID=A0A4Z2EHD1_9TELE|nr:hypothetical protein EYF80_061686 [Liparis tanakae]
MYIALEKVVTFEEDEVQCWSSAGPVMDQCWSSAGPVMDQCWSSAGPVMDQCWSSAGPLPVLCRSSTGPLPVPVSPASHLLQRVAQFDSLSLHGRLSRTSGGVGVTAEVTHLIGEGRIYNNNNNNNNNKGMLKWLFSCLL